MGLIKDLIKAHADKRDDFISEWYWRKQYNTLRSQMNQLLEVTRSDIYKAVIDSMTEPLIIERYKRENNRLRNRCKTLVEERDSLKNDIKLLKKKGGTSKDGEEER